MLIQEEYALRHGLMPGMVGHTIHEGIILLRHGPGASRNFGSQKNLVMNVRWIPHDRHPGTYSVQICRPVHDSGGRNHNHTSLTEPITITYEDYGIEMRRIVKSSLKGYRAMIDPIECDLFSWESFLCCYDTHLVRSSSSKLCDLLGASIDTAFSTQKRYDHFEAAIRCLESENPTVYENWSAVFAGRHKKIIPWLAMMINGD